MKDKGRGKKEKASVEMRDKWSGKEMNASVVR